MLLKKGIQQIGCNKQITPSDDLNKLKLFTESSVAKQACCTVLLLLSHFSRVRLCVTPSWDYPGKNTGMGCQCIKVKSESEAAQSCQ